MMIRFSEVSIMACEYCGYKSKCIFLDIKNANRKNSKRHDKSSIAVDRSKILFDYNVRDIRSIFYIEIIIFAMKYILI